MAKKPKTPEQLWKQKRNREILTEAMEESGTLVKGTGREKSRLLDKLKQRNEKDIALAASQLRRGYTLDMMKEIWSKDWQKEKGKSGGEQGHFRSARNQKAFEDRHKKQMLKNPEKYNPATPKLKKEEKEAATKLEFSEFRNKLERNRIFSPEMREEQWKYLSDRNEERLYEPKNKHLLRELMRISEAMGVYDRKEVKRKLHSDVGMAVLHYMLTTGASRKDAMQTVVYDVLDTYKDHYEVPTVIPKGVYVRTASGLNKLNTFRRDVGLEDLTGVIIKPKTR